MDQEIELALTRRVDYTPSTSMINGALSLASADFNLPTDLFLVQGSKPAA